MLLYELVKNYGLAVILFALVVKVILLPFQMKSKRSMLRTSRLQPKLKELEKKHGANKQKYNEEVAKLYKEEGVNPMSGCLWSLIPFPILLALFSAIRNPITIMMGISKEVLSGQILPRLTELGWVNSLNASYEQISQTQFISSHFDQFAGISDKLSQINYNFLGMNLGDNPKFNFLWTTDWSDSSVWLPGLLLFLLPIASGVLAFLSSKVSMKMTAQPDSQQAGSAKTMMLFMPLINVYFAFIMPGAIGVYIIASMVFQTIQEIILTKHYTKVLEAEEAVKFEEQRKREAELEAKRLETERKKLENSTQKNPNTSKKCLLNNQKVLK
jgi:YidC/Oxa1 family membrane protein insertase